MKYSKTGRGFRICRFVDEYQNKCSLQESSLSSANGWCVWLGLEKVEITIGDQLQPFKLPPDAFVSSRMHLTRDMVAELIPLLQHFVDTGELPDEPHQ
jgi:hypothetical protein